MNNRNTTPPHENNEKTCAACKYFVASKFSDAAFCWKRGKAPQKPCKNWKLRKELRCAKRA